MHVSGQPVSIAAGSVTSPQGQRFFREVNTVAKVKTADVVFRDDLYPRIETSVVTVQKYAEDLSVLPPIVVNQHNELIDGWHRWTAHKKNEELEISVVVVETASDADLLQKAIELNATHGLQLSQADKKAMAQTIYNGTPDKDRETKKKELATILSVSERTVRDWLSRIDKDAKAARKERIFSMWLAGYTQQEIADDVGMSKPEVNGVCSETADLPNLNKHDQNAANHETDFDPPIYNVWKQQSKTAGASHFGNSATS